ncbi:DNA repair exonuclease [Acidobacteria bacterium AH-259-D05]|nr:DNA repair exonuclease [Acidobacteria bacterium AH-259-D05]
MGRVTLLAIGDVHLGTHPSSLPENLDEAGLTVRDLGPEAALTRAVDLAIRDRVDTVLFAGDVVESTNARFEALRPLEAAVHRLDEAGIPVLAVAGNHDVEALPRLASRIEGFTLLGTDGAWQCHRLHREGQPVVEIVGWCFPEREVLTSPLLGLLETLATGSAGADVPRIGLLHADLDSAGGRYAPVARRELAEAGLDAWLLGHIHRPSLAAGNAQTGVPCGYLGSLVGLDPTETGPHGPWRVHVAYDGTVSVEQVSLAPLRWETLTMPVEGLTDPEDLGDAILDAAGRLPRELEETGSGLRALGVRVRLEGPTREYAKLRSWVDQHRWAGIQRQIGETLVFVNSISSHFTPAIDLVDLAAGADPPALLAGKLLALEGGGPEAQALIEAARTELRPLAADGRWSVLEDMRDNADPLSDQAVSELLHQAATDALHALLAQRPTDHGETP